MDRIGADLWPIPGNCFDCDESFPAWLRCFGSYLTRWGPFLITFMPLFFGYWMDGKWIDDSFFDSFFKNPTVQAVGYVLLFVVIIVFIVGLSIFAFPG